MPRSFYDREYAERRARDERYAASVALMLMREARNAGDDASARYWRLRHRDAVREATRHATAAYFAR